MNTRLSSWFESLPNSQTIMLGSLAVLLGLTTGAGVWLFKGLIELIRGFIAGAVSGWVVALIPIIGGIIVGLISYYLVGNEKLFSTAGIMQSVALSSGRLPYQKAPIKTIAAIFPVFFWHIGWNGWPLNVNWCLFANRLVGNTAMMLF